MSRLQARLGNVVGAFIGRSYWDSAHGLGPRFRPGEFGDYYRDYRTKVDFLGHVTAEGLPLVEEPGGIPFLHPMVLAQKALGHWGLVMDAPRNSDSDKTEFLRLARALLDLQTPTGGWPIPSMEKDTYLSPISALAQGQCASVLARAHQLTKEQGYLERARRGIRLMLRPMDEGGTARFLADGIILEEFPRPEPDSVLNGWVSALFALYDMTIAAPDGEFEPALEATLAALVSRLPHYDAGYWSYYDCRGRLASPYYHAVHISQLQALQIAFPDRARAIEPQLKRFQDQYASFLCRTRAIAAKVLQRLFSGQTIVLRQPRRDRRRQKR